MDALEVMGLTYTEDEPGLNWQWYPDMLALYTAWTTIENHNWLESDLIGFVRASDNGYELAIDVA